MQNKLICFNIILNLCNCLRHNMLGDFSGSVTLLFTCNMAYLFYSYICNFLIFSVLCVNGMS
ncbi:unknown [Prevotella sp. CAG:1185]|nr:unknown [Prevotella sp. CAG:1185]